MKYLNFLSSISLILYTIVFKKLYNFYEINYLQKIIFEADR